MTFDFDKYVKFIWDKGNLHKSYEKYGIIPNETEEVFLDPKVKFAPNLKHSVAEPRFVAIGKTFDN